MRCLQTLSELENRKTNRFKSDEVLAKNLLRRIEEMRMKMTEIAERMKENDYF